VNNDGKVNTEDLYIFGSEWLTSGTDCDFVDDDIVNFRDFAAMAGNWTGIDTPPSKAINPIPSNNDSDIPLDQVLSWSSSQAASYDVYFGTANPPAFKLNQTGTSYSPALKYGTTYYWRIDSKNSHATIEGDIYNFTTVAFIDPNQAPTADSNSYTLSAYTTEKIDLRASDDGLPQVPGKLKYTIRSLPTVGKLYDPASGGGEIKNTPYSLSSYGNQVIFISTSAGNTSFTFDVNDGIAKSSTATISLTISEYVHDSLYVSKPYIKADSNHLDLDGQWGIVFWIKTSDLYGTVLQKGNFKVQVINGVLSVDFYDAENSTVYRIGSQRKYEGLEGYISDGQWHYIALYAEPNDLYNNTMLDVEVMKEEYSPYGYIGVASVNTIGIDCNNTSDFIIGSDNFKFQIDRLCLFNNDEWVSWNIGIFIAAGATRENTSYGWSAPPKGAEWQFNEGDGNSTVDAINNIPIDLNDGEWTGKIYMPVDMTVQRRR
jgi:hypothetical protein